MLHTLIVGMGRSGQGLHLPALARVRAAAPGLMARTPILAVDPFRAPAEVPGVVAAGSLEEAARLRPPSRTVVHLCTPPGTRASVLARLAALGYRKIIVEKPLAVDLTGLVDMARIRRGSDLDVTVATHWLDSALTRRLHAAVRAGRHGELRRIDVIQNKPRFTRSTAVHDHPTAFDVELPHALAVVLSLAGRARVAGASWEDMVFGRSRVPRLGRARLRLNHVAGVRTEIDSDLTSPVRERRITLEFDRAVLVGHYPCSEADSTAQLRVVGTGGEVTRSVFTDDAFAAFLRGAYARYAGPVSRMHRTLPVQVDAVRLLAEAKRLCAFQGAGALQREEVRGGAR
ncbi:oxidoreductase [Actinomadura darangshiensis]|uniref:Oxidoreductase n=1 Tax=Actinomadura darangshiensis TaxID=705336 RepID=A0A4R5BL20_9ACTN|nr:Gfo/Idh/MocA family oxidoreductase [Actinomadura darangshiensis]TDD85750.1 oxidoreductase [Actinomadura darangshiensis]